MAQAIVNVMEYNSSIIFIRALKFKISGIFARLAHFPEVVGKLGYQPVTGFPDR